MRASRRSRREWHIILWVSVASAAISAVFGYRVAPEGESALLSALIGVATSLTVATPILVVAARERRMAGFRRLRRLPLAIYFAVKVLFYFVVIIGGLILARHLFSPGGMQFDDVFRRSIVFAIAMSVAGNLIFTIGSLLGFGTLKNLFTGRYVRPRREQRAFLLIDLKDSTGLAERLGPVRFHELLNAFFRDVDEAALECDAEIHKYVGDEAILTWPDGDVSADGNCLACPFLVRDAIAASATQYRERFGVVPEFRAALHRGEIVAGEIGDVRREIAYVGDTLNVAARLLDAAKDSGHDILVSKDLLDRIPLPADLDTEPLSTLTVRGRIAPLAIAALKQISAAT